MDDLSISVYFGWIYLQELSGTKQTRVFSVLLHIQVKFYINYLVAQSLIFVSFVAENLW